VLYAPSLEDEALLEMVVILLALWCVYGPPTDTNPALEWARGAWSPAIVTASLGRDWRLSGLLISKAVLFGSREGGRFRFASSSAKQEGHIEAWSGNRKKDRYGSYT
jgi:hypothetical protein